MKTTVADKKGKKRTHNEHVKLNQAQGDVNEFKKNFKKAKFVDVKQNGSPALEQKAPVIHKKKGQNKTVKQQSSPIKQSITKGETKAKTELTVAKPENETKGMKKKRRSLPYSQANLTMEQLTKKIAEIQSREELSKTARRKLGILNRKLKEFGVPSEKLDALQKKSNKKAENRANVLMKKANDEKKTKPEKKLVQSKGKPQEIDDDDSEEEEIDSDVEEEEESDENERQNVQLAVKRKEVEDESDEDEDDEDDDDDDDDDDDEDDEEDENKLEIEEGEEGLEIEEDEELESDEDEEESLEDEEDEEDDDDDEDDEDDENDEEDETGEDKILKKLVLSGTQKKEMQNKQEQNKNKQVPQSLDNQQKGELHKKRYVLFVGNLPLDITENEIKQHFLTKVNTITSIRIPTKPDKTPRGFAYVEMTNNIDFEKGLSLNHSFLKKRRINVEYSRPSGGKNQDANKKFIVAKNMKLQALQKAGKLADGNQKKKFKKGK